MNIIEKHQALLAAMDGYTVEAGWFASARYQAGEGVDPKMIGVPVAEVARKNEFGGTSKIDTADGPRTIKIPARPFMREAVSDFKRQNTAMTVRITRQVLRDKLTPKQALGQIGMAMENTIVNSIKNGNWAPNSAYTIAKKGFDKPLIDTGQMWQSVASKVVKS